MIPDLRVTFNVSRDKPAIANKKDWSLCYNVAKFEKNSNVFQLLSGGYLTSPDSHRSRQPITDIAKARVESS